MPRIDRRGSGKVAPSFELRRQIDPKHNPLLVGLFFFSPPPTAERVHTHKSEATKCYYIRNCKKKLKTPRRHFSTLFPPFFFSKRFKKKFKNFEFLYKYCRLDSSAVGFLLIMMMTLCRDRLPEGTHIHNTIFGSINWGIV